MSFLREQLHCCSIENLLFQYLLALLHVRVRLLAEVLLLYVLLLLFLDLDGVGPLVVVLLVEVGPLTDGLLFNDLLFLVAAIGEFLLVGDLLLQSLFLVVGVGFPVQGLLLQDLFVLVGGGLLVVAVAVVDVVVGRGALVSQIVQIVPASRKNLV